MFGGFDEFAPGVIRELTRRNEGARSDECLPEGEWNYFFLLVLVMVFSSDSLPFVTGGAARIERAGRTFPSFSGAR